MDKYEYKVRADEIKELIAEGEYAQAAEIADTIDWRRVKSVMMLCTVSDLYKINRRYEDAKNMLLLAYERRPGGKTICYSLCELYIKTGDFVKAVNYYKEFAQVAPKDSGRYILQYKLYEAQEVSLEERIGVLEELKKRDYREKWAYELAYLYHRVGLATRCVEECDELILWFGEGKYVIKAMELKMLHQPLTAVQQEKYEHRFDGWGTYDNKEPAAEEPVEEQADWYAAPETPAEDMQQDFPAEEPVPEGVTEQGSQSEEMDIQVKMMDVGQYNTINLQAELAAGLKEVLDEEKTQTDVITRSILAPLLDADTKRFDPLETREAGGNGLGFQAEVMEESEVFFGETGEMGGAAAGMPESGDRVEETFSGAGEVEEEVIRREAEEQPEELADADEAAWREAEAIPERIEETGEQAVRRGVEKQSEELDTAEAQAAVQQEERATDDTAETVMRQLQKENKDRGVEQVMTAQPPEKLARVLSQEPDGQLSLVVPENETVEKQITGQMNIGDILNEWERMKKENAEKRREEVRQHVREQTGTMFTEFEASVRDGLLEKLESGRTAGLQGVNDGEGIPEIYEENPEAYEENPESYGEEPEIYEESPEAYEEEPETYEEGPEAYEENPESYGEEPGIYEENPEAYEEEPESYGEEPGPYEDGLETYEENPESYGEEPGPYEDGLETYEENPESYGEEPGPYEEGPEAYEEEPESYGEEPGPYEDGLETYEENPESYGEEPGTYEEGPEAYEEEPGANREDPKVYGKEELKKVSGRSREESGGGSEIKDREAEYLELQEDSKDRKESRETSAEAYIEMDDPAQDFDGEDQTEEKEDYGEAEEPEEIKEAEEGDQEAAESKSVDPVAEEPESGKRRNQETEGRKAGKPKTREQGDEEQEGGAQAKPLRQPGKQRKKPVSNTASGGPVEREKAKVRALTKEEKELYAPFIQSRAGREKLIKAIDNISMAAYTGNIIITGEEGMDKLTLAKNMIREVQMTDSNFSGKVAKIGGQAMNSRNVEEILERLKSGALIIESASGMEAKTVAALHKALQQERLGIIVVLEDTKRAMANMLTTYPQLKECFTARLDMEAMSNEMLVAYGKQYAREMEYSIDEMGVLALHTRIEELQTIDHAVNTEEVKRIVDEAIRHANRKTPGHFFDILFAKRYDEEDMIILTEKDFA